MKAFKKFKQGSALIVAIVIVAIVGIVGIATVAMHNGLVSAREEVATASSDIDTNLQRRLDLIPNLVESVKGYMRHEDEVISKVTEARANLAKASTMSEKSAANAELDKSLDAFFLVVENYPDLKASTNFAQLNDELAGTENRIATSRKDYNEKVKNYNTKLKSFPTNIIAGMFNFTEEEYFEADESAKEVPKVDFSNND